MLTSTKSRGSSLTKRKRMKRKVKKRSHLVVKGQRACRRLQSLQKTLVIQSTRVERLPFQRIMVSVNSSLLRLCWSVAIPTLWESMSKVFISVTKSHTWMLDYIPAIIASSGLQVTASRFVVCYTSWLNTVNQTNGDKGAHFWTVSAESD